VAAPRFFFDEDLQGVGQLIQKARDHAKDVWVIGHEPCPIRKATPDEVWLPRVAPDRPTIFRIDTDLLDHNSASYRAWRRWGCRGFVLNIQQSQSSLWDQLRALMTQWHKIENHISERETDRFWVGKVTQGTVRPI
jgi:hypothetical protein